jgi:hypothetical protein
MIFSEQRLRETGSVALYRRDGGFAVDAVTPAGNNRPWARNALAADESGETAPARGSAARPADATPSLDNLSAEDQ